jgi:hypothetical protein
MASDGPFVDEAPPRLNEHRDEILDWLDETGETAGKKVFPGRA